MTDDWTVDIPIRTPKNRQASKDEAKFTGCVLGKPATLVAHGSSIRLKVTGFACQQDAEAACPQLCFGLLYMSLLIPIPTRFKSDPQKLFFAPDPRQAARNFGKSLSIGDIGEELHAIMNDEAPAIYPTGNTIRTISMGEATWAIIGLGEPGKAIEAIADGAAIGALNQELPDRLSAAIELFNLSGFEPSPRAAFIIHCTALEQLFTPRQTDPNMLNHIERFIIELDILAAEAGKDENQALLRLRDRIGNLRKESIFSSVINGASCALEPDNPERNREIANQLKAIYKVRHTLAHEGRADLGDAPQRLQEILRRVIIAKLVKPPSNKR